MENSHYLKVRISQLKAEDEEILSSLCFDCGAEGIAENLEFSQTPEHYDPITIEKSTKEVDVFFLKPPSEQFFTRLAEEFPGVVVEMSEEENKDWLEEWKKGFEAFELAGGFWVVPSWLRSPVEAKNSLNIDPGMAFGTGTHETTQLCAQLLVNGASVFGSDVIDVGTGTGILALLSRRLGAKKVVATEIDPVACKVAQANLVANDCSDIAVFDCPLDQVEGSFDLVIANIIDGVLLNLQDHLKKKVAPGGQLLLSGLLAEREPIFLSQWQLDECWTLVKREKKGEWLGLLIQRASE